MRKLILPVCFIAATTAIACSVQVGAGRQPTTPAAGNTTTPAPRPAPTPVPIQGTAANARRVATFGKRPTGALTPAGSGSTAPAGPAGTGTGPAAGSVPIVSAATPFGNGTPDPNAWAGTIFFIAPGATKVPDLATPQPNGLLFSPTLDISSRAFTEGFPGVDAARKENFAIRYEAAITVTTEADYTFRLASDDGAIFRIGGTVIVDNDGTRTTTAEKTGPVHLVAGTHLAQVDYFSTTGNVALQLFCKKTAEATDKICPTNLQ